MRNAKYEAFIEGEWREVSADELLFWIIPSGKCEAYRAIVPVEIKQTAYVIEEKVISK